MSSISSAGDANLSQWLQGLNPQSQTSSTFTPVSTTGVQDPSTDPSATEAPVEESSGHHHGHHHGLTQKLESAITSALSSSDGSTDPNQVVQDAVKQFLSGGAGGVGGANGSQNGSDHDGGTAGPASANAADPATQQSSFKQLLSSYGIDANQFQQDLQGALQGSSDGGNVDFAKLFQNFPPGSAVNTLA